MVPPAPWKTVRGSQLARPNPPASQPGQASNAQPPAQPADDALPVSPEVAAEVRAEAAAIKAEQCQRAEAQYQDAIQARRIYRTDEQGNRIYMSEAEADQARIRGAEFTLATTLAEWDLALQLSHVNPRNRSEGANYDNLLTRRARNTGRVDLDRAFGDLRVGLTLNGASHRFDDAANTLRLGGYATTDLRLEYAVNPHWTLQARATNIFDRDYETIAWFHQPGREYGLTLRWRPASP